nr:phosphoribosylanthranilate isomerase [Butyrivibrio sp.]
AFVIKCKEDLERAGNSSADYLLLDSGKGTGQTFNWELIREAAFDKPFFLAGGLGPENVAEAIDKLSPYAVDVSSGIETNGVKDPDKMRQFMGEIL